MVGFRKKHIPILSTIAIVVTTAVWTSTAFGYVLNSNLSAYGNVVQKYAGSYTLIDGDNIYVKPGGPFSQLDGQTISIAAQQAWVGNMSASPDSQGTWNLLQADMQGADANNGYLLVADPSTGSSNVQQWVSRLGGNLNYVTTYLQQNNQQMQVYDYTNSSSYTYDPFAIVANESGAEFGNKTIQFTGQYDASGYPIYKYTYPVYSSNPPQVTQFAIQDGKTNTTGTVTQGDPVNFITNTTVWLWSGLATYHYVAIELKDNATGQTQNIVGQGYNIEGRQMTAEQGGHGYFTQTFNASPSLKAGDTYTATMWVADGVHRFGQTATATFTVTQAQSTGGSGTGGGTGTVQCTPPSPPPPQPPNQVLSQSWQCTGNGGQNLSWTDTNWVLQTNSSTDANGCAVVTYQWVDQPVMFSHYYDVNLSSMQITGLFYDPGSSGNLWSPQNTTASQSNHDAYTNNSTHWGGPPMPTYGNPNSAPAIYVRAGGGFGFHLMWTGSPNSTPSSGSATFTMTNPDGNTRTWTEPVSILPTTQYNMGTYINPDAGGGGYPQAATEWAYVYTPIPKYTNRSELAKWNLDGNATTAAHIEVSFGVSNSCGTVTWTDPQIAQLLNYPTYYFNHEIPAPGATYLQ